MRSFVLLYALGFAVSLSAQDQSIVPDKNKDGKYALIDKSSGSKELTAYDFDYIGEGWVVNKKQSDEKEWYFSCRKGKQWGVLYQDGNTHITLKDLDTLWMLRSRDAFKLRYEDQSYDYYNIEGKAIASGIVREKRSPYARYRVLIKRDGTQSIIHRGKEVVKPIPYELDLQIQNLARTFLVKNKSGYYVINLDGFPLNEEPFDAATPIDFNGNLAVKKDGKWMMLDNKLNPVDDQRYFKISRKQSTFGKSYFYLAQKEEGGGYYVYAGDYPTKVNSDPISEFAVEKSFGLGHKNGKWAVLIPETLKFTDFKYERFDRVAQNQAYFHLLFCQKGGEYRIVDEEGVEHYGGKGLTKVIPLTCESGARLLLYKDDKIALVDNPATETSLKFEYEDAACGSKGYYLKKDGKWGMIDNLGKVIVDFTYKDYKEIGQ